MSSVKTVKVSNLSLGAWEQDVKEFFSFSGDIEYVEMRSDNERSQIAYVTFKDSQGAETAVHLSGATIVDMTVTISLAPEYQLPPFIPGKTINITPSGTDTALRKAEDVVSSVVAKSIMLGKDAVSKAKSFDEKHKLTSSASAKVISFDRTIGLTEKISTGTSIVSEKVREVDHKFQITDKSKSAFVAAGQKVNGAGSAIMKNRYVFTGALWVTGAFNKVAAAASEVAQKAKEKVVRSEEEEKQKVVEDFAQIHLSESPETHAQPSKPPPVQGLIL